MDKSELPALLLATPECFNANNIRDNTNLLGNFRQHLGISRGRMGLWMLARKKKGKSEMVKQFRKSHHGDMEHPLHDSREVHILQKLGV